MKRLLLALLFFSSTASAQDVRVPEYDHTGITTNDVLYWTGTAWDDQAPSALAANIALENLSNVEKNDTPGMTTSANGTTWAPTTVYQYAVNIGGWCFYTVGSGTAAPAANTSYLIFSATPWDNHNYSPSSDIVCGPAYIHNSTDGTRQPGWLWTNDNGTQIRAYQKDLANFLSTKNYSIFGTCFTRCDTP